MNNLKPILAVSYNLTAATIKALPAFAVWVLMFGSPTLVFIDDVKPNGFDDEIIRVPGWAKHELRWVIGRRGMLVDVLE